MIDGATSIWAGVRKPPRNESAGHRARRQPRTTGGTDSVAFALRSLANRAKLRLNRWVRAFAKFPEYPQDTRRCNASIPKGFETWPPCSDSKDGAHPSGELG
jgi:hypothetical protein